MVLLATLAVQYVSDLADLERGTQKAIALIEKFEKTASSPVKVGQAFTRAAQDIDHFSASASKLVKAEESAASASSRLSSALHNVGSAAGSVQSHVKGLGSNLLDMGSKLGMTVMGITGLAQGAMDLGKTLFGPVASAEQMSMAFTTLMGSSEAAKKKLAELSEFADKTAFDDMQVSKAAAQLIGMGVSADKTIPIMKSLGDALYGVGHGSAAEFDSVVDIFGKISVAGKLTGEDLSQLADHGIGAAQILASEFGKTVPEIQDMASKGLIPATEAIDALTVGIQKNPLYKDQMAKQATTLNGLLSTMGAYTTKAVNSFLGFKDGEIVAGSLLDTLKNGIAGVGQFLQSPAFQSFAEGAGKAIGDTFSNIVTWVGTFLDTVNDEGLAVFIGSLQTLADTVGRLLAPAFEGASNALSGFFSQEGAKDAGLGVSAAFYDIAEVVYVVNDAIKAAHAAWIAFQPTLEQIGAFLAETFTPVWDQLQKTLNEHIIPAWNDLVKGIEPVMPQLQIVGAIIAGLVVGALGGLVAMLGKVLEGVAQFVGGAIEWISGLIQFWSGAIAFIVALFTGDFEGMWKALETMMGGIQRMFKGAWEMIQGVFKIAIDSVKSFVDGFVKSIVGFFTWLYDQVVGHSIIPDMVAGIVKWLLDLGPQGLKAITTFIDNIKKAITDFAAKCIDLGKSIIDGIVNGIKAVAGNIGAAIKSVVSGAAASVGITIPGFAEGVTDFSGGLAMVGEKGPELVYLPQHSSVLPISSSPARTSSVSPSRTSASSSPQYMTIIHEIDGREISRIVSEYQDATVRTKYGSRSRIA